MRRALALVVDLHVGQAAVNTARRMNLADDALKILSTKQKLCIPLSSVPSESEKELLSRVLGAVRFEEREFLDIRSRHRTLLEALGGRLPSHLLAAVPRSLDIIGHVAILELPSELVPFGEIVGKAVLEVSPNVRTVMAKAGAISSDYRVRELRLIAGEDNPLTRHREHGCIFELDVKAVFFSPRLSQERLRIASQVEPGEVVVDMFAGVGPYSVLIAKKQPKSFVYAVEVNPAAFSFLVSNILANKVLSNVKALKGDVRDIVRSSFAHEADRAIMNLPGKALDFIEEACLSLRERGGIVHFYSFESAENPEEAASTKLRERVEICGRKVKSILDARVVKAVAPYLFQVGVDALVN